MTLTSVEREDMDRARWKTKKLVPNLVSQPIVPPSGLITRGTISALSKPQNLDKSPIQLQCLAIVNVGEAVSRFKANLCNHTVSI